MDLSNKLTDGLLLTSGLPLQA